MVIAPPLTHHPVIPHSHLTAEPIIDLLLLHLPLIECDVPLDLIKRAEPGLVKFPQLIDHLSYLPLLDHALDHPIVRLRVLKPREHLHSVDYLALLLGFLFLVAFLRVLGGVREEIAIEHKLLAFEALILPVEVVLDDLVFLLYLARVVVREVLDLSQHELQVVVVVLVEVAPVRHVAQHFWQILDSQSVSRLTTGRGVQDLVVLLG